MSTISYQVTGLHCAEEVAALRAELSPLPGVQDLTFDILNNRMTVAFDPAQIQPRELEAAVLRTGMSASLPAAQKEKSVSRDTRSYQQDRALMTALSGFLLLMGIVVHGASVGWAAAIGAGDAPAPWLSRALYIAATLAGAWYILPKAWFAVLRLRPDMNLLMTVAVIGAIAIGEFMEAATVAFLFALSLTLESWSIGRARRAVAALMALSPPRATVRSPDGSEELRDVIDVPVGSTVIVKPGEKFPLDGRITKGETTANQAPITGESRPVPKTVGDEVFAGTINDDGAVELITTKVAADTTLARITRMVGDAQARRAPSEQWVEMFARYYPPSVMVLAVMVAALPPLFGGSFAYWFYQALVLLVIACPCALVISTPVSIVAALASAARHGVLIKGGLHVETPARLKAVALDKTGTLTEGQPQVQQVVPLSGHDERELLEIASAIEQRSEHPLARAIVRFADSKGVRPTPVDDYQTLKGKGATARLNGNAVWIGSHRLLEERAQESPDMHAQLEALSAAGASIVVVGNDEHVCGFIAVADRVREASRATVAALRNAGIEHVIMLTGDNHGTARAVAETTGVDEVRAELLPEQKVTAIEELVARYGAVAMVGDGVNDAPALARSTLGIAMGAAGTDAALETADVALMSDDLSRLPWLIRHSRRTLAIIHQNIVASLVVKAVFILLTLAGHASLWAAIVSDTGISLLVVLNALRLLADSNKNENEIPT